MDFNFKSPKEMDFSELGKQGTTTELFFTGYRYKTNDKYETKIVKLLILIGENELSVYNTLLKNPRENNQSITSPNYLNAIYVE